MQKFNEFKKTVIEMAKKNFYEIENYLSESELFDTELRREYEKELHYYKNFLKKFIFLKYNRINELDKYINGYVNVNNEKYYKVNLEKYAKDKGMYNYELDYFDFNYVENMFNNEYKVELDEKYYMRNGKVYYEVYIKNFLE